DEQNNGTFDMLMMGWLGNIDPDDYYYAQHHTDGASNAQRFSDPEVDRLLDAARAEPDRDRRRALYDRAATLIADRVSYLFLYNPGVVHAGSPGLAGCRARRGAAGRCRDASLNRDGLTGDGLTRAGVRRDGVPWGSSPTRPPGSSAGGCCTRWR